MYELELKNVHQGYTKKQEILKNINIQISAGQFVAVVGPSGAGKTTLLRLFNRMVKPSMGEVCVEGTHIENLSGRALEKVQSKVAMIYQDFCLVNASTCWQNVLNGCLMRVPFWRVIWGKFPNQEKTKALAALKQVGLEKYALEQVAALSGGQKQRVAIARALQQEAAVILADEPVASVDPLTAEQILNILKRLQQEQGLTIVMNSHSVEQAKKYAQRIIGLKNGAIFLDKAAEDWTKEDLRLLYEDGCHE